MFDLGRFWPPNYVSQLAGLMTDLGDERGGSFVSNDLKSLHGRTEDDCKSAGFSPRIRKDLQQLL